MSTLNKPSLVNEWHNYNFGRCQTNSQTGFVNGFPWIDIHNSCLYLRTTGDFLNIHIYINNIWSSRMYIMANGVFYRSHVINFTMSICKKYMLNTMHIAHGWIIEFLLFGCVEMSYVVDWLFGNEMTYILGYDERATYVTWTKLQFHRWCEVQRMQYFLNQVNEYHMDSFVRRTQITQITCICERHLLHININI